MKIFSQVFRLRGRRKSLTLLSWAGWLLLGISWGMSFYAYSRLPGEVAHWLSLWKRGVAPVAKSWRFFYYPLAQTLFFFGFLWLARIFSIRKPGAGSGVPPGGEKNDRGAESKPGPETSPNPAPPSDLERFQATKSNRFAAEFRMRQLLDAQREVIYLASIFVNLIFIHFQTTLILISHRLSRGVNSSYLAMLVAVLAMLIPYYLIRRKMLERIPNR